MRTVFGRAAHLTAAGIIATGISATGWPPQASAVPAGFPDLSGFALVDVDNFLTDTRSGPFGQFLTLYHILCDFSYGVDCAGTGIPDPAKKSPPPCWWGRVNQEGTAGFKEDHWDISPTGLCEKYDAVGKSVLLPGQKLTYKSLTCAVGDGQMLIACLDTGGGQHGFVLKPSGNIMF